VFDLRRGRGVSVQLSTVGFAFAGLDLSLQSEKIDPLSNKKGIDGNRWQAVANMLFTMRCETVAVGCHRLRVGLFERFLSASHSPPVATGCARWAP